MSGKKIEKTRYGAEELAEFEVIINDKLEIARTQLTFYMDQLKDHSAGADGKVKGLDNGQTSGESEKSSQLALRQQKLIQHLENAKIRIKNSVYGVCRATGKLISKERLKAVPHATLSIEAKEKGLG